MEYTGKVLHIWIDRNLDGKLMANSKQLDAKGMILDSNVTIRPNTWQVYGIERFSRKVILSRLKKAMIKDAMKELARQVKFISEVEALT